MRCQYIRALQIDIRILFSAVEDAIPPLTPQQFDRYSNGVRFDFVLPIEMRRMMSSALMKIMRRTL